MSPRPALHALIWGYTAAHVAIAARLPLAAFEAHYALYASRPALSYVDHPPLTAWLQALALAFGDEPLILRVVPIGLSVLAMYLLAALARRCRPDGNRWHGVACVAALQGTLVFHIGIGMSPDAPLVVLSLLVVWVTLDVLERDRWSDWLRLGMLVGLAGLAKYTSVTLALSVVAILVLHRGWSGLWSVKPWGAALLAVLVISPVLIWNAANGWVTIDFHMGYQVRTDETEAWTPLLILSRQLEQVLFYSPLLYLGGLWAVARRLRRAEPAERALYVFALPILVLFLLASMSSRGSAHWSLVGWILLIPPAVQMLFDTWARRFTRSLTYVSACYSAAILVGAAVVLLPAIRWPDFAHPIRALVGWQEASARAARHLREIAPGGGTQPVLLVRNWHHAERLAWYARPLPVQNVLDKLSPYTVLFGEPGTDSRGILMYPQRSYDPPMATYLWPGFDCRPIDRFPVWYGPSLVNVFFFYLCEKRAD